MEQYTVSLKVRLTSQQYDKLVENSELCNVTPSEFLQMVCESFIVANE